MNFLFSPFFSFLTGLGAFGSLGWLIFEVADRGPSVLGLYGIGCLIAGISPIKTPYVEFNRFSALVVGVLSLFLSVQ